MNKSYKIRSTLIFLLFIFCYLIIITNLYTIQIKRQNFYANLGDQQYNITMVAQPDRNVIYDRNHQLLAMNQDSFSAFMLPTKLKDSQELSTFLHKNFPQAAERLAQHPDKHFLYVQRKLLPTQIELIQQSKVQDIHLLKEPNRFYPVPSASPVVGITNIDNQGLFGIEARYNERLSGTPTTYGLQRDARSGHFHFQKETKLQGASGSPVTLTLDSDLQFLVTEELAETVHQFEAQEGAVVVLDPTNGHLIVLAHYPSFDPHVTHQLQQAETKVKTLTDAHELGSVIKVFTALAALEQGLVTPDELIDCENTRSTLINGVRVNTWKAQGTISFSEVIQSSNNIGIAKVALRLGDSLYDHYTRVGFGTKTNINWPGEQAGFVNHPSKWSRPSPISLSFGYEIRATLVQLAAAYGVIANDGKAVVPQLIIDPALPKHQEQRLYQSETIKTIQSILEKTVTDGTAHKARLKGYRVMGKTGTANMVIDGKYDAHHNIYTFVGIIQKDHYKRVIVTFIKDAQRKNIYASTVAVPLFERVAQKVLIHDSIITTGV